MHASVATAELSSIRASAIGYLQYLRTLLDAVDLDQLEAVVSVLRCARQRGAAVYIVGNGGSAATASHFATDLANLSRRLGKPPLKVVSLVDNTARLTALANDTGYANVFSEQLEALAEPGDVLIAISASGNSPCLLRAAEVSRARGLTTIGLLGFDGGALLELVDLAIHVRSLPGVYGPVEDVHVALAHMVAACLAEV